MLFAFIHLLKISPAIVNAMQPSQKDSDPALKDLIPNRCTLETLASCDLIVGNFTTRSSRHTKALLQWRYNFNQFWQVHSDVSQMFDPRYPVFSPSPALVNRIQQFFILIFTVFTGN